MDCVSLKQSSLNVFQCECSKYDSLVSQDNKYFWKISEMLVLFL